MASQEFSAKENVWEQELEQYQPIPVVYQLRYSILSKIRRGEEVLPDIQGREETKGDMIRAMLSGAHPYLVSEEGTGKTRLARSVTRLLPPLLKIKDCPYNDDPKWPPEVLCPRCRAAKDPAKKYGVEVVSGERRFSRIQGNEYTNEAKLLGLKDIQAIAQGRSPTDPLVFTGTGVFRANRGILFVDELPAIRTNVQVLFHPILEEKKVILEEYNWHHPLDVLLIATGNPKGFSHVYEVPRPLLDRLELIYMDLPEEEVEKEIMLRESFGIKDGFHSNWEETESPLIPYAELEKEIERRTIVPWWVIEVVNKTVRYSRICPKLEKKASIRASNKALDHTHASVEMENRRVANLKDAYLGLRLALRGRIGLSSEYLDIEEPKKSFKRTDRLVEDLVWNALEDFEPGLFDIVSKEKLVEEMKSLSSDQGEPLLYKLQRYPELGRIIDGLRKVAGQRVNSDFLNAMEKKALYHPEDLDEATQEEYLHSALEMVVNAALHRRIISDPPEQFFIPQKLTEWRSW
jgi:magnesium chelatase subunit I